MSKKIIVKDGLILSNSYQDGKYVLLKDEKKNKSKKRIYREIVSQYLINYCPYFSEILPGLEKDIIPFLFKFKKNNKNNNNKKINNKKINIEPLKLSTIQTDYKFRSITGSMQSRKTPLIISIALQYILIYKISVIVVIQNNLDAYDQMFTRFTNAIKNIELHLSENLPDILHPICTMRGKNADKSTIKNVIMGEYSRIFLTLRSKPDLEPLNDLFENQNNQGRIALIIDESDFTDSGVESYAQSNIDLLKMYSSIVWFVSATPLTNLIKEEVKHEHMYIIPKQEYYKGIENVKLVQLTKPCKSCSNAIDNAFEKDKNLKNYLINFANTNVYTISYNDQKHPVISLCKIGNAIQPQIKVAEWMFNKYGNKVVIITYNSESISLRGHDIPSESIKLSDGTWSNYENKIHKFREIHIGLIIEYLQKIGNKIKRILIISGNMANRGISFGSTNYDQCIKLNMVPWHLTEMYFTPPVCMDGSNLLQSAGRLCGCYRDNIPLTLYSNFTKDIKKCYNFQEEIIHRSKMDDSETMKESLVTIPISKTKVPRRKLYSKSVKISFNKVKNDSKDGGWEWEENKEKVIEGIDDVEIARLEKRFDEWSNKKVSEDGLKVRNFMIKIVKNGANKIYDEEEIKSICKEVGIQRLTQLTYYKKNNINGHGYGMILEVLPGDKYRLQPKLVNKVIDYFENY